MFGTLVISLPSNHEGGEVIVRHSKETKRFRTEDFEQSYISWLVSRPYRLGSVP